MKFYYQILTTPTGDTPGTTVLLHFPDRRYFFGQLSEGTQRACTERGIRLTYLTDTFLTGRTEWANNGGLIGTILTQAEGLASSNLALEAEARERQEKKVQPAGQVTNQDEKKHGMAYAVQDGNMVAQRGSLTIHGGKNLSHSLATARRFVFRKGMPVFTREYDSETMAKRDSAKTEDLFEEPSWFDNNIKVWAMPIAPSSSSSPPSSSQQQQSCSTGQQSPRKRSLDEFQEKNDGEDILDRWTREQVFRQSVITDMFNSSWKMDSLVETPLAEVNMPAAIFIRNPETKKIEQYKGPAPGSDQPLPDIKVLVRQPWPGARVEKLPPTTWCDEALSYIVRNHDIRGKFDVKKAEHFKVRKGPDYSRLTKGESVTAMDGSTVTPDMVLGSPRPGKGFAIVDLPSPEYVENLINRPEWKSPAVTTELQIFLWILGPGVGDHPKLREFVSNMPDCKHIVSSTDYCPNYLALGSVAESSIRLARLKGDSYSVPFHDNVTLPQPGTATHGSETTKKMVQDSPFEQAEPGQVINMEPKFELNRDDVVPRLNPADTLNKMAHSVEKRIDTIKKRVQKPEFKQRLEKFRSGLPGQDAEITFLGTGSSSPSKYRNVSSTLVKVPGYGYYLLDCGENTLGQLKRVFNPEQLREVLLSLRMIWISHLHADHHLGTAGLIKAWYQTNYPNDPEPGRYIEEDMSKILDETRLFVVSESMMTAWLEEYAAVENYGFHKVVALAATSYMDKSPGMEEEFIQTKFEYRHTRGDGSYPGQSIDVGKPATTTLSWKRSPLAHKLRAATGLSDLRTTRVSHCRGSMAVSLIFPDGFKLSYSGDCRPSRSFTEIGKGSTVLIHEATFENDMQDSAKAKKHSTIGEALEVGRLMKARTVLLTHFSQRYQKVAFIDKVSGRVRHGEALADSPQAQAQLQDHEEPETLQESSTASFKDEVQVHRPRPRSASDAPVATAFDYMRIRVGDIPVAEAYAPAIEKLFEVLERASMEEAMQARRERHLEVTKPGKKAEKRANQRKEEQEKGLPPGSLSTSRRARPGSRSRSRSRSRSVDDSGRDDGRSVWSASESESGWSTSDPEDDKR